MPGDPHLLSCIPPPTSRWPKAACTKSTRAPTSGVIPQVGVMYAFHSTCVSGRVPSGKPRYWLQRALQKRRALGRDWGTCSGCKGQRRAKLEAELPGTGASAAQQSCLVRKPLLPPRGPRYSFLIRSSILLQLLPLPERTPVLCQELDLAATTSSHNQTEREREHLHSLPSCITRSQDGSRHRYTGLAVPRPPTSML